MDEKNEDWTKGMKKIENGTKWMNSMRWGEVDDEKRRERKKNLKRKGKIETKERGRLRQKEGGGRNKRKEEIETKERGRSKQKEGEG